MDRCTFPGASASDTTESGVHASATGSARVDGADQTYPWGPIPSLLRKYEPLNPRVLRSSVLVEVVEVGAARPPLGW